MTIIDSIKGDICNLPQSLNCKYIAQQSNCVSKKSHGLSQSITNKWPYANRYAKRIKNDTPGDVYLSHPESSQHPIIIHLFGQYRIGKCNDARWHAVYKHPNYVDSELQRLIWFKSALTKLETLIDVDNDVIFIPFQIGCGLAGGDWNKYKDILNTSVIQFIIVKWN